MEEHKDKKTQVEIRKSTFRMINAINQHAKPRKYDWIALVVSCLGILVSAIAIIVAVNVPRQIAEQQNKIALFEKRFNVYNELKAIDDFLNDYYKTQELTNDSLDELSKKEQEIISYQSIWEGEIHQNRYPNIEDIFAILSLQSQTIESLDFLFSDITSEEMELCENFYNTYRAMTERYVLVPNADGYIPFGEFDDNYERFELKDLLEKLKSQLYL